MRVELKKSWTNTFGKKYPVGTILQVGKELRKELKERGFADDYSGKYPPEGKKKIELANLKY